MKIGIFDSGLGGLAILSAIVKKLPNYNYVYLGDNARTPYGGRSLSTIYDFTKKAIDELVKKKCTLIIVGCNTVSAGALRKIQQEYLPSHYPTLTVLGVIRPIVEELASSKAKKVGVIGTYATIDSKAFIHEFSKLAPQIRVYQQACPLLVPFIEEGESNSKEFRSILTKYLKKLKKRNIDSLLLACTHYSLVKRHIQSILGKEIKVFAEEQEVAKKLADYLVKHDEIQKKLTKGSKREFYVTDANRRYKKIGRMFLDIPIAKNATFQLVEM